MSLPSEKEKQHIVSNEETGSSHRSVGETLAQGTSMGAEVALQKPLGSFKAFSGWLVLMLAV